MSYGTIVQSGRFVADGTAKILTLRSDVDVIQVFNWTAMNAGPAATTATEFKWFRGMAAGDALITTYTGVGTFLISATATGGGAALNVGGFTLIDSSSQTPGAAYAITAGTNATQPVYTSAAGIAALSDGDIVRIQNTAHTNINGLDFTITKVGGNDFRLENTLQQAPGVAAGGAGTFRRIPYSPIFYPRMRVISNITAANPGVVTTLVNHGYTTGQKVRFFIPESGMGMQQLNGVTATVTVLTTATFSIDIDTTAYNAFVFPVAGVVFSPATVIPVGEDSAIAPNVLADATENQSYIGMQLAAGAQSPAGVLNDVIYWTAYKTENN